MSHLTSLEAAGFKGPNFTQPLKPLTIVTGANFSGKSRILDAIRVLLLGYHPGLGKQSTFELSTGASMSVAGEFADGTKLLRGWSVKKGSITQTMGDKTPAVPAMMLDAREYFSMSGQDRIRYVIEGATDVGLDDDAILAAIRSALNKGIPEPTPEHERLRSELEDSIRELASQRETEEATIPQFVHTLMDDLAEKLKAANATLKRLTGSVQTTSVQKSSDNPVNQQVEAELSDARDKHLQLSKANSGVIEARKAWREKRDRCICLDLELAKLPDSAKELAKLETEAAKLAKVKDCSKEVTKLQEQESKLESDYRRLVSNRELLNERFAVIGEDLRKRLEYVCPCCKGIGSDCKSNKVTVAELEARGVDQAKLIDAITKEIATAKKLMVAAEASAAEAVTNQKAYLDAQAKIIKLQRQIGDIKAMAAKRDSIVAQLATVKDIGDEPKVANEEKLKAAAELIERLEVEQKRLTAYRADLLREGQSREQLDTATAEVEILKLARVAVEEIQVKLVTEAFGSLIAKASKFTEGLLQTPLAYHDGDMGRWEGPTFIRHRTFTATEANLAYAGLSLALAQDARHKIVLFDEWLLDQENREKFVKRLQDLIKSKVIDQALLVDINPKPYRKLLREEDLLVSL